MLQAVSCRRHCHGTPTTQPSQHAVLSCRDTLAQLGCLQAVSEASAHDLHITSGAEVVPICHAHPTHKVPSTAAGTPPACAAQQERHTAHKQSQIVGARPGMCGMCPPCQAWEGPLQTPLSCRGALHWSATMTTCGPGTSETQGARQCPAPQPTAHLHLRAPLSNKGAKLQGGTKALYQPVHESYKCPPRSGHAPPAGGAQLQRHAAPGQPPGPARPAAPPAPAPSAAHGRVFRGPARAAHDCIQPAQLG